MKSNVFDRTISVVQRRNPRCAPLLSVRCAVAFTLICLFNLPISLHAACQNERVQSSSNSIIQSWINDAAKISNEEQHCETISPDNATTSAIVNGEYVFRGYDLTEGPTNSFGAPVVGGEATSTRLLREEKEAAEAQSWYQTLGIATGDEGWGRNKGDKVETLTGGIMDQFQSGGNYAYGILASLGRKTEHVYDPEFDPSAFIDKNRKTLGLEDQYFSTIMGAGSESEAQAIVENINDRKAAQKRTQRMGGLAQVFAYSLAALPDIAIVLFGVALVARPFKAVFRRGILTPLTG